MALVKKTAHKKPEIIDKSDTSPESQRRALRVRDFCNAYGFSKATTYNLIKTGRLRTVRIGGIRLIPVDAAESLLTQP